MGSQTFHENLGAKSEVLEVLFHEKNGHVALHVTCGPQATCINYKCIYKMTTQSSSSIDLLEISRNLKRKKRRGERPRRGWPNHPHEKFSKKNLFLLAFISIGRSSSTWSSCWNKKTACCRDLPILAEEEVKWKVRFNHLYMFNRCLCML